MRDPKRIRPFMNKLADIWEKNCPDWRFGQLIENVFSSMPLRTWAIEEDTMLEEFKKYFENQQRLLKGGKKRGQSRRQREDD